MVAMVTMVIHEVGVAAIKIWIYRDCMYTYMHKAHWQFNKYYIAIIYKLLYLHMHSQVCRLASIK